MKAFVFVITATAVGAAFGSALGVIGSLLQPQVRASMVVALGLLGAGLGALEVSRGRLAPPQCSRETPQLWLDNGALVWSARNGATLGAGFATRLGFWLWFAVPIGALLSADAILGAVLYGTYGFVRGSLAPLLLCAEQLRGNRGIDALAMSMLRRAPVARRLAAAELLAIGIAAVLGTTLG